MAIGDPISAAQPVQGCPASMGVRVTYELMLLAVGRHDNQTTSYFAAADAVARRRLERRAGALNAPWPRFPMLPRIIPWSRGAVAKPGGNAFVARRGLSVHSTRVGRPQPALAFATEAAQRLDIPLVLVDGGGKDRPSTQLALLAQRGLVEFQLFLDGFDPLLVRRCLSLRVVK